MVAARAQEGNVERASPARSVGPRHGGPRQGRIRRPNIFVSADWGGAILEWSQGTLDGPTTPIAFADDRPLDAMALRADGTFLVTAGDQLLAWDFDRAVMKQSAERFLRSH